jgi:hypothetical protein
MAQSGARLSYINWLDDPAAVFTPSKELSGMPAINVGNRTAYLKWRALLDGDPIVMLDIDFQQERSIQVLGAQWPRRTTPEALFDQAPADFAPDDTIQVLLSNTAAGNADVYDSGELPSNVIRHRGVWGLFLSQAYSARYMRVIFTATSRLATSGAYPVAYMDLKRFWAGPLLSTRVGFNYGIGVKNYSDSTSQRPQRGTSTFTASKNSRQQHSFVMGWIDDASEGAQVREFLTYMTNAGEFFFHRHDLPVGEQEVFGINSDVYPMVGDNFEKSSLSMLFDENI